MTSTSEQIRAEAVSVNLPGSASMTAYLARPEGAEGVPGVVVIHELFGLNDNIREIARRFAAAGYAALAVDLFSPHGNRNLCLMRMFADLLLRPLDNRGIRELQASVSWLQDRPEVNREQVGVIGFCMGGGYAVALACVERDISAASVFYGMNPRPLAAVARACPIVGSYAENDPIIRRAGVKLDRALKRYGVPHDIKIYPGTSHSFMNAAYDENAATDAFSRTLAFFDEHVRGAGGALPGPAAR